jgi:hypothetical protein
MNKQLLYELSLLVPAANILNSELRKLYAAGAQEVESQKTSVLIVQQMLDRVMKSAFYYRHLHKAATSKTLEVLRSLPNRPHSMTMVAIAMITRHDEVTRKLVAPGVKKLLNDFYDLMLDHEYNEEIVKGSEFFTDDIVEKLQLHYFEKIKYKI